ncbi:MAG: DNA polymerase IV [Clostridia bacterium]|nr:DNA polymerase IV [Clostridia bacterium]
MAERLIFHVDVNSAFLSWEAVRRVRRGEPDLREIPSAVGGNRETRRGVILAKSVPAKRFGVTTGEPVGMALRKCPTLQLVEPDFKLYLQSSRAFMEICRRYAPVVEAYSIDECFLDMTGTHLLYPDPVEAAHRLRREIRDTLGFTVNIGIGPNKLLAKIAGDFEKPDRVHTLFAEELPQKLWPLSVDAMLGVGKATAEALHRLRLHTVGDVARLSEEQLQASFGQKLGRYLYRCSRGLDDSPVSDEPEELKGYSVSTTTEQDVTDRKTAQRLLLQLTDSVSARMRRDGARALGVAVKIRYADFKNRSHQRKLDTPTDLTDEIYTVARRLLLELWDGETPLRLLGIGLFDIRHTADGEQLTLFEEDTRRRDRSRALDRTVDDLRARFGVQGVVRGSTLGSDGDALGKKHRAQLELTDEDMKE